jgi:WD40 repeat protein
MISQTDMIIFTLIGHTAEIVALKYMGNDEMGSAAANGEVMIWNVMLGKLVRVLHSERIESQLGRF